MIKFFKDFFEEIIKTIKESENNIPIKKEEIKDISKKEFDDFLAMYSCGIFDDIFK